MNLNIEIDAKEIITAMRIAPEKITYGLNVWVAKTTLMTEREAKLKIQPRVDTGQAQSSIHSRLGHLKGEVSPTAKHAIYIHQGRKPGRMPPSGEGTPLNSWARRHGIPPYLVARSIARKGTKAHPFMHDAFYAIKPEAERDANKMLADIVRKI